MINLLLSTNVDLEHFCDFLGAVQVSVDAVDGRVISVSMPGSVSELHERRELGGYITTWNALHPGLGVRVADADPS